MPIDKQETAMNEDNKTPGQPWWKHGHVWLVIAGPAIVVVAGCVTAWIAMSGQDKLVESDYYRKGIEINKQLKAERSMVPALQGRNHAATAPADD